MVDGRARAALRVLLEHGRRIKSDSRHKCTSKAHPRQHKSVLYTKRSSLLDGRGRPGTKRHPRVSAPRPGPQKVLGLVQEASQAHQTSRGHATRFGRVELRRVRAIGSTGPRARSQVG